MKSLSVTGWSAAYDERRRSARRQAYRPLVPVALAVVLGIALDRQVSLGVGWWALALAGLVAWRFAWRWGRQPLAIACLLTATLAAAAAWDHACWRLFNRDEVGRVATNLPEPVCLRGVVTDAPRGQAALAPTPLRAIPQGEKTVVLMRVTELRDDDRWRPSAGQTELIVDGNLLGVHAGDRLEVFGQLRGGGQPLNPGQFDFAADARGDRQLARVRCESPDCVRVLQAGSRWSPWRWMTDARSRIEATLATRLGPRRSPLAAAMLIGARQSVARDRAEVFRRTGTLHVLVVSGLHVGLVVAAFYAAVRVGWFPRRPTLLVVMLLILIYTLLTGARPPAVRAAVLAEVMCLAAITGRNILAINSLAAATVLVLALNPADLFRSGPQLSFIAAATLIWFGNRQLDRPAPTPIERLLASARPWPARFARATIHSAGLLMLATLVVWLVTAPLLLCRFNLLSPVAVPISLAVFPLVSAAVVSGLVLVIAEAFAPPLAEPAAWVCGHAIDWLEGLVNAAYQPPGGSFWSIGPAGWWTIGIYALLGAGLLVGHRARAAVRLTLAGFAWVAVGAVTAAINSQPPDDLRCSILAVGHGCSVLIETPDGGTLLYDAGSLGSPEAAAETIAGVLWSKGIRRIDALVLSHADVDHFNAAPGLFERFGVGAVYVSPAMFAADAATNPRSAPAVLRESIRERRLPLVELRQGDRLTFAGAVAEVLHPIEGGIGGSDNANSLVLAIEHNSRRVLLPGDLEAAGMEDLVSQMPYDCDVLLAPHHGSARSDPPGFAAWSRPEWVVVSGGGGEAYSAIAGRTYAASGAQVLRSARTGMISFDLAAPGIRSETFLGTENPAPDPLQR